MTHRNSALAAALLLGLGLASGQARAQAAMDMTGMGVYSMEEAMRDAVRQGTTPAAPTPPTPTPTAPTPTAPIPGLSAAPNPAASLSYRPSAERRRANMAQFVAKTRAADPAGAAQLEALVAQTDLIEAIGKEIAPFGLRIDNLADAYTMWWISAWQASRGITDQPSRPQIDAVKTQAGQAMAQVPGMAAADDAVRQEMAEAFLLQAALLDAAMQNAAGKPDQLRQVAEAARQGAQNSGLDLAKIELTDRGFVAAAR